MLGQSINHYKITAKLAEGGMREVYQATDTRSGREVALKILPERLVQDRQRMGRFQREAAVLASLNHPHIGIIHGLEEVGDVRALVLELVEGPTLAERIAEGPIPLEEALRMALEISQALEAAHERGIIHGHLKPSNVRITPEGTVKVLDFGLVKVLEPVSSQPERATSPTQTLERTRQGIVPGTAAYMSPEKLRGQSVDKRTDIWSFGMVLFEMLTGKAMYTGKSSTETLAAVIHQEPSLEQLPPDTPRTVRNLLERCLRKSANMRLRDMGDARIALDEHLSGTVQEGPLLPFKTQPLPKRLVPWLAVPLLMVLAWVIRGWSTPIADKTISRWELSSGQGQILDHQNRSGVALSPDGSLLAFVAAAEPHRQAIYLRSLNRWDADRLSDDIAWMPFFSPDGAWLGAFSSLTDGSDRKLKKYPVEGGTGITICDCVQPFGATWASDDTIIFTCEIAGPLWRVSALGGEPEQITELDKEAGELSHRLPHAIPGTNAVLFTVLRRSYGMFASSDGEIAVQSLKTGERKALIKGGLDARYVPSGHLVFAREGTLWAAPFDRTDLAVTGPEFRVLEGVSHALHTASGLYNSGAAQFAVSSSGSLAYIGGSVFPESKREILSVDRDGRVEPVGIEPARYHSVRLSPDESRLAVDTTYKSKQVWTFDLDRGTRNIQTPEGMSGTPIWSPDGETIIFTSDRGGINNLFSKRVDDVGDAERLFPNQNPQYVGSWSPDGEKFAFNQTKPDTYNDYDIWILSMDGSDFAEPFLDSSSSEICPEFSPNGRWLAYTSDETGRHEVYVQRYPEKGGKQPISTHGGRSPVWSGSGDELFYYYQNDQLGPKHFCAVDIGISGNTLIAGNPVLLFKGECVGGNPNRTYDVTPDGFLMISRDFDPTLGQRRAGREQAMRLEYFGKKMNIVLNWSEELRRLAPSD